MVTIILIVLVVLYITSGPYGIQRGYWAGPGYYTGGGLGVILLILLILWLTGAIGSGGGPRLRVG
jgi:Protein of unknown function (DUF3309)